jgi:hypothetical protein
VDLQEAGEKIGGENANNVLGQTNVVLEQVEQRSAGAILDNDEDLCRRPVPVDEPDDVVVVELVEDLDGSKRLLLALAVDGLRGNEFDGVVQTALVNSRLLIVR